MANIDFEDDLLLNMPVVEGRAESGDVEMNDDLDVVETSDEIGDDAGEVINDIPVASRNQFRQDAADTARMAIVKECNVNIRTDDPLYFVASYFERVAQLVTSDMQDQLRLTGSEVINSINDAADAAVARINDAAGVLTASNATIRETAEDMGRRLYSTRTKVIEELRKDREVSMPLLKSQFVEDLSGENGEIEKMQDQVRKILPVEVRVAVKAAFATESEIMKNAMNEGAAALLKAAGVAQSRVKNGWLKNIADDCQKLFDEKRYLPIGVLGGAGLFVGFIVMRIFTGIFH